MMNTTERCVRKAIIPIAGNGTRMFPETFFIKKVMLPVMDDKGVVKPALLYMLEELEECGIEDIYLIVGDGEPEEYEGLFRFEYNTSYEKRLPEKVRGYYRRIHDLGKRLHFVVQKEKKGFGHAVYQAREYLNGEAAVLLLGDFLYRSNNGISCTQQTIDAYSLSEGKAVVGIREIEVADSANYGVLHGVFKKDGSGILDADAMVEKPGEEYSRRNLLTDGKCFATFGSYVLTDDIFEYVGRQIEEKDRIDNPEETDLTGAFMNAATHGRLVGVKIDGESFDVGLPEMYYKTFIEFGRK